MLAQAVAAPQTDALLIDADNKSCGYATVKEAIAAEQCFAVEVKDGLVVCDADAEAGEVPYWVAAVQVALEQIGGRCALTGSGRPGHLHVWCLAPVGWSTSDLAGALSVTGIPRQQLRAHQRIRPPLSRHRLGSWGTLRDPDTVHELLRSLAIRPGRVPLAAKMREVMVRGDEKGEYRRGDAVSRDVAAYALAVAYVNADLGMHHFNADMMNPANRAGSKVQGIAGRDPSGASRYLRDTYERAREYVRLHPPSRQPERDAERMAHLQRTVAEHAWVGRAGATDRVTYAALVDLCARTGADVVGASLRTLSLNTGSRPGTVANSLKRLESEGLVVPRGRSSATSAARFQVLPERSHNDTSTSHTYRGGQELLVPVEGTSLGALHDAFRPGAFPKGCAAVLAALPEEPSSVGISELCASVPGPSRKAVRAHLSRLLKHGVVVQTGAAERTWSRVRDWSEALDRVAQVYGTAGSRERRVHDVEIERDLYRRAREAFFPPDHLLALAAREGAEGG